MTIRDKFNIHGRSVKETKSPLAPQSDDEVAKKESDNTKSKNKKNDADEEKADKAKIEPVKLILKDFNNAS
jgi:predicted  nucleic acid-binding Zn-ribbon protein